MPGFLKYRFEGHEAFRHLTMLLYETGGAALK
jgi:hypothetical protein